MPCHPTAHRPVRPLYRLVLRALRLVPSIFAALVLLALALVVDARPALAATLVVDATGDEGQLAPVGAMCTNTVSGHCTLRSAIQAANALGGGPHTIVIQGGATYTLTIPGRDEEQAATGDLDLTADVQIVVGGSGGAVVQASTTDQYPAPPGPQMAVDRVFEIRTGGALRLVGLTVRNGNPAGAFGGAILNRGTLVLANVTVADSLASAGGGIFNGQGGTLTATDSAIVGNGTGASGSWPTGNGGGVASYGESVQANTGATVTLVRTTVASNFASIGGGIFNSQSTLLMTNSTLIDNTSFGGAGLYNSSWGLATLASVTVTGNSASGVWGGIVKADAFSEDLTIRGSIVFDNSPSNCESVTSAGYNLLGAVCSLSGDLTGNVTGQDPLLGGRQDNGGFTETHAIGGGSPAINAGPPGGCLDASGPTLTADQRGVSRSNGGRCDIGAYEVGSGGPVIVDVADQATLEDLPVGPLAVLVADSDTPAASASLAFALASSDQGVVQNAGLVLAGSGGSRAFTATPAPDASGAATITVTVQDGSGLQASDQLALHVTPRNDAPSFTPGANVVVGEDSGPYSAAWASALSPGPTDEASQTVSFEVVGNTSPGLFAAGPVLAPDGTLSFMPAANANGVATVTVRLRDTGGTANGGTDASVTVGFTITVSPSVDVPMLSLHSPAPAYLAGDPASVLDSAALVADADSPDLDAGQLNVSISSGGSADDRLEIRHNAGADPVEVVGNTVSVGGVPIGGFTGGAGSTPLQVTFNVNATVTRVQAVLRNVTFRTTSPGSPPGPRTTAWQLSDGDGGVSSVTIVTLSVIPTSSPPPPPPQPPTISDVPDQSTREGTSVGPLPFTVGDPDTPATSLTVTGASSDSSLVPPGSISVLGSGVSRTVSVSPSPGRSGSATITLTVSDGQFSTSDTFVLTVTADRHLAIGDVRVEEAGGGGAVFTVTLTPPSSQTVTVEYASVDASAVAGADYRATSGTLTFLPGETTKQILVEIKRDQVFEPDELFVVNLHDPRNATLVQPRGVGTIVNDSSAPAACATHPDRPRPQVRVASRVIDGRLQATVTAIPMDAQTNNPIVSLRFGQVVNAHVTLGGRPVASGTTVTLPPGTVEVILTVERVVAGQPTTVPLTVVDTCGEWSTFVGGGNGSGF